MLVVVVLVVQVVPVVVQVVQMVVVVVPVCTQHARKEAAHNLACNHSSTHLHSRDLPGRLHAVERH